MTQAKHRSIISAKAGFLGGRLGGSLRLYAAGPDGDLYFSFRLWLAAEQRQRRLSSPAYAAR